MPRFSHTKLVERIAQLDISPPNATEYATWIKAGGHTDLLRENASGDELVIFAAGPYTFIDAVVVGEDSLAPLGQDDLLSWSGNRNSLPAPATLGVERRDDVWIERGGTIWDAKTPKDARSLVFQREIEGLKGSDRTYFENTAGVFPSLRDSLAFRTARLLLLRRERRLGASSFSYFRNKQRGRRTRVVQARGA